MAKKKGLPKNTLKVKLASGNIEPVKGPFSKLRKESKPKGSKFKLPKKPTVNAQYKRPRGRPPKNSVWNSNSGEYVNLIKYPKDIVKAANERLRKLEKVFKWGKTGETKSLAESSERYQNMLRYRESYPLTKGKIYKTDNDGRGLRFISKKGYIDKNGIYQRGFEDLTDQEKEYYVNELIKFMESASSTKTGIHEAHRKSYETFMKNNGSKVGNLTYDEYLDFFGQYNQKVVADANAHFSYSDLSKALFNIKIDVALRDNQLSDIMQKIHSGRREDWADIPKRYLLNI